MKSVSDATTKLQRSLGSTANKECEDAIDTILDATSKLDSASLQELQVSKPFSHCWRLQSIWIVHFKISVIYCGICVLQALSNQNPDSLVQVHQAALQELASSARNLGGISSQIVSSATSGSAQLGESSRMYVIILSWVQYNWNGEIRQLYWWWTVLGCIL